jgi:hypothetical protein
MSGMPPPVTMLAPSSLALAVVGQHLLLVDLADQRADLGVRVEGAAGLHAFGLGLQGGDELVEDRALDIDALGAQADLAAVLEAERVTVATALSKSQSANTTAAFLPPSSSDTGRMPSAPAFMMAVPVLVSPVKVMPLTSGWAVRKEPAELTPKPLTTL